MANPKLIAQPRKILGRKVKKLRREGVLPANLYGKKIKSQSLEMNSTDFFKIYKEVGETGLVDLTIGKQVHPVLIHNLQAHPVTSEPLHVDFRQVSLTEKTTATVPIEIRGEAPAVEQKLGILIQPLIEVEVEALPADLPDELVVDVSQLAEVNQTITVADLVYDKKKVELKAEPTQVVAKINPLEKEEVVAPPPTEEVPAEGEVPVEGEVPAEGVPPAGGAGEEKPAEEKPGKPEEKSQEKPAEEKK